MLYHTRFATTKIVEVLVSVSFVESAPVDIHASGILEGHNGGRSGDDVGGR